jgi:hypothetical protein
MCIACVTAETHFLFDRYTYWNIRQCTDPTLFAVSYHLHFSLRNQVESCNTEKEKLLENASNLVNEKLVLIRESEESTRQLEHQYELKLK